MLFKKINLYSINNLLPQKLCTISVLKVLRTLHADLYTLIGFSWTEHLPMKRRFLLIVLKMRSLIFNKRSTEGVLRWAVCDFDGLVRWYLQLPLVTSYVTLLHVGSVVMIFLALSSCFVAFQKSLCALNSLVQVPVWGGWHGKPKCKMCLKQAWAWLWWLFGDICATDFYLKKGFILIGE